MPIETLKSVRDLVDHYELFLFDAYGVVYDGARAIPIAADFLRELTRAGKPHCILTNDASCTGADILLRFQAAGVPAQSAITPCDVISRYFEKSVGLRCVVLGPEKTRRAVKDAGGVVVPFDSEFDVLIAGDESGFSVPEDFDAVLSQLFELLDRGHPVQCILLNPDLIYPRPNNKVGITAGSYALLIEQLVHANFPLLQGFTFQKVGKPETPMFEEALARAGTRKAIMFGDSPATDIRGASRCGIDSVLLLTGLTTDIAQLDDQPTYIANDLSLDGKSSE